MSSDGMLPDGVEDWHVPGNRPQDRECELPCPCAEDAEVYDRDGDIIEPVCICAELLAAARAAEAEFRRDCREDR